MVGEIRLCFILLVSLVLLTLPTSIYGSGISPLNITPEFPVAGEPFALVIPFGGHSAFCAFPTQNPQGRLQNQTLVGNVVILEIVADPIICPATAPPPFLRPYVLNPLDEGDYSLQLYWITETTTFPTTPAERFFLGEISFGVGPAPIGVPLDSPGFLIALTLAMILLGLLTLRKGSAVTASNDNQRGW